MLNLAPVKTSDIEIATSKLNLFELVLSLGLSADNYPYLPSDCFSYTGISSEREKEFREHKVASLSTLIIGKYGIIKPDEILSSRYSSSDELLAYIKSDKRFPDREAVRYAPEIVETGMKKLIGFCIIKCLKEVEDFPVLMGMREVILACKTRNQVSIRGACKGGDVQKAAEADAVLFKALKIKLITHDLYIEVFELLSEMVLLDHAVNGSERAKNILKRLCQDNQKLLPAILPASGDRK